MEFKPKFKASNKPYKADEIFPDHPKNIKKLKKILS